MEKSSKEIIISGDSLIMEIQKEFDVFYPFLKIEFSAKAKAFFFYKKYDIDPVISISKITNLPAVVKLNVDEDRTVAEVEKD